MLNEGTPVADDVLQVISYTNPIVEQAMENGAINTDDAIVLSNIASAIRRGHPQIRPGPTQPHRIALVGSGPSLRTTERDLINLLFEGRTKPGQPSVKLVTVNGAYHWCLERNLQPSMQIVMDARPSNARFVDPVIPNCMYVLASQCAPETWDAVDGRPDVWIFHAATGGETDARKLLDHYYHGQWVGVGGGVTVATRAICLLRMVGFIRFDLFGIDSCWIGQEHHAFPQQENAGDQWFKLRAGPVDAPDQERVFRVSPWHLKQFSDFLQVIKVHGQSFQLAVHGDGLLAYAFHTLGGHVAWKLEETS